MKFIISNETIRNTSINMVEALQPIKHLIGKDWESVRESLLGEQRPITHLKHISVTLVNHEWVVWIDDEVITKQLSLIGKIARFIVPIIMSMQVFADDFKADVKKLNSWINEEK